MIKTATLRTEVERHRASKGVGQVSSRVQGPRVLPALNNYATGIAAFLKGVYDVGQGVREVGKAMRGMGGKMSQMKADNQAIRTDNQALDFQAKRDPVNEDYYQLQKKEMRTFGSYW